MYEAEKGVNRGIFSPVYARRACAHPMGGTPSAPSDRAEYAEGGARGGAVSGVAHRRAVWSRRRPIQTKRPPETGRRFVWKMEGGGQTVSKGMRMTVTE